MLITYFGIILFEIFEWIKFIKPKPISSVTKRGVAYAMKKSMHEVHIKPAVVKLH